VCSSDLLRELGATAEQIDRETEQMRKELIGTERPPKQLLTPFEK
jgi:hypothetical protein